MSRGRSLLKWSVILFIVSLIALWFIVPLFPGGEAGPIRTALRQALFWPLLVSFLGFAAGLVVVLLAFVVNRIPLKWKQGH